MGFSARECGRRRDAAIPRFAAIPGSAAVFSEKAKGRALFREVAPSLSEFSKGCFGEQTTTMLWLVCSEPTSSRSRIPHFPVITSL
jgi:hypothetical protein